MRSRLELWWGQLGALPCSGALAALLLFAMGSAWLAWASTTSRSLTPAEHARFGQWVEMTADPAVARAYAERRLDGRLTAADVREIMEVAKAHGPGPGLAGPGDPER